MSEAAVKFAIEWWKNRHEIGYFPAMEQHLNWKVYEEIAPWFAEFAKPHAKDVALEIGAGYGQWMAPLSRLVASVYGFDIHPSLVLKAQESLQACPNAVMKLGDGTTIPFPARWFSLVYSISVFQHMPRAIVSGYLVEAERVLRTSGRAVFHFRHADGEGPYSEDIVDNHEGDWSVGWTEGEAEAACVAAGLRVVRVSKAQSLIVRAERA
jgi:SAM-dependent methyltransferase